jgi:hypothetical protein
VTQRTGCPAQSGASMGSSSLCGEQMRDPIVEGTEPGIAQVRRSYPYGVVQAPKTTKPPS